MMRSLLLPTLVCLLEFAGVVAPHSAYNDAHFDRTLQEENEFETYIVFFVSDNILGAPQIVNDIFVDTFIDSYNEGNEDDPEVCDPFNRTAISGTFISAGFDLELVEEFLPEEFIPIDVVVFRDGKLTHESRKLQDIPLDTEFPLDTPSNAPTAEASQLPTSTIDFDLILLPSAAPIGLAEFEATPYLVQIDGTCDGCPDGSGLFDDVYDVAIQKLRALRPGRMRRVQEEIDCLGPNSDNVLNIFQENLDEILPNITILGFVELEGNVTVVGDGFSDVVAEFFTGRPSNNPSMVPSIVPSFIPTFKSPSPTQIPTLFPSDFPTVETPSPTEKTPSPTEKTPSPTDKTPSPTDKTPSPTDKTPNPTKSAKTPNPTNSEKTPAPSKSPKSPKTPTESNRFPTESDRSPKESEKSPKDRKRW